MEKTRGLRSTEAATRGIQKVERNVRDRFGVPGTLGRHPWVEMKSWGILGVLVLGCTGCRDASVTSQAPLVTDSAGIQVVHYDLPPVHRLLVSEEPEVVVGASADGSDALYRVRGGVILPNGDIAIANAGSLEILYFSSEGTPIRRVGREGEGPEEFSGILWMQHDGAGRLAVYDVGNMRVARLDAEGRFVSTQSVRIDAEAASSDRMLVGRGFPIGVTEAGRVLSIPWAVAVFDGVEGPLPLVGELRSYAPDLSGFDVVDSVRLRTWYEKEQEEGPPVAQVLESPILVSSANGRWIAYSEASSHNVVVLEDGHIAFVISERRAREPFSPDSVPWHLAGAADSLPAYRAIQVDSDGRIWVQSPAPQGAMTAEWRVFADNGMVGHTLSLPASTSVLDAVGERVLLLERDTLDVETVAVRQLSRVAS